MNECLKGFVLPSVFGSGITTASTANSLSLIYSGDHENTNSQLVRLLFDNGIIGAYLYIYGYLYAFRRLMLSIIPSKHSLEIPLLFFFCATLAHRSSLDLIILGVCYSCFIYNRKLSSVT